jgi:hypothetical protein
MAKLYFKTDKTYKTLYGKIKLLLGCEGPFKNGRHFLELSLHSCATHPRVTL